MNKSELVEQVASSADVPKSTATKVIDAMLEIVSGSLAGGEDVVLVGFGTFAVKDRPERTGRNPKTGEPILIKASKVPSFKAGKVLKEAVNG